MALGTPGSDGGTLRDFPGEPLPYVLSLPGGNPPEGRWPVLCFLHGYDEAAPMPLRAGVTRHGPLRPGSAPAARAEFIVVAPQLSVAGDRWHREAAAVAELVAAVRDEHGGDPRRTYLTGFSFGANGVFDLGIAQPGAWAALWAVDPTRVPRSDPGCPVWLSIGSAARSGTGAFVRALGLQPPGDGMEGDRIYLDEMEDHVASATRAYADERIYRWLLARRLDG